MTSVYVKQGYCHTLLAGMQISNKYFGIQNTDKCMYTLGTRHYSPRSLRKSTFIYGKEKNELKIATAPFALLKNINNLDVHEQENEEINCGKLV